MARCSTGQTWNGRECEGQIVRLNFEEIQEALKQANEQLGDGWRSNKIELKGLFVKNVRGAIKLIVSFSLNTCRAVLDF